MSASTRSRLQTLGWDEKWAGVFDETAEAGEIPARLCIEYQDRVRIGTDDGDAEAMLSGLLRDVTDRMDRPAVGDWVAVRFADDGTATITRLLPRRSVLVRKAAGEREVPQIIAANVDRVFVITSLNREFNVRRLERYAAAIGSSGAQAALVLNKSDLADPDPFIDKLSPELASLPRFVTSVETGEGLDALEAALVPGETIAFVGSSGVGKSSIVNFLLGREVAAVAPIRRSDDEGRHTTRNRVLTPLPSGSVLIDTPGMREIQPWDPDARPEEEGVRLPRRSRGKRASSPPRRR
jgi:ribosome biogenesis GTPase